MLCHSKLRCLQRLSDFWCSKANLLFSCSGGILLFTIFWWEFMAGIKPIIQFSLLNNQYLSLFDLCNGIIILCWFIKDESLSMHLSFWFTKFANFVLLFCDQTVSTIFLVYASQFCLTASCDRSIREAFKTQIRL